LCKAGTAIDALKYLQVEVAQTVDHKDPKESLDFRNLTATLFEKNNETLDVFKSRTELYEKLLEFLPEIMKQPKGNLIDLLQY